MSVPLAALICEMTERFGNHWIKNPGIRVTLLPYLADSLFVPHLLGPLSKPCGGFYV